MTTADAQPTQPIPDAWAVTTAPAPRRRRAWPWIVAIVIVVGLAIVAWFAGEAIARNLVVKTIRDQVITQLALPAGQDVRVDVPGPILPQLIGGTLGEVTIASDDVPIGSFAGDVVVTAHDVPIRGGDMAGATARVTLDEQQLRELMATVDGFPAGSVGLAAPNVTMSTQISLFGVGFPVTVALTPSAVQGDLLLTPATLQLAGASISADELRQRFGQLSDAVLRDWTVCVAQYIPSGITLTDVAVQRATLVADFDIDGGIVSDPALQANGTCKSAS
ncbi:DUF2993 domain-containing protein [Microbacterium deminutum]|uniref:DUF2993 domain-containing protein n=1 Tax=Microbacterium deminutum TaxID=344164 RepID=A0ABN2QAN8_9MICO